MSFRNCLRVAVGLLLAALGTAASADTITFGGLGGANGDPFPSPYAENNWIVQSVAGNWFQGQDFGNPVPSVFAGPVGSPGPSNVLLITDVSNSFFNFTSADLACNNGTDCPFVFVGLVGGGTVYTNPGSVTAGPPFQFFTEVNPDSGIAIDALAIGIGPGDGTTSMNVDNIVLSLVRSNVPEPSAVALLALALLGMGLVARRQRS